MDSRRGPSPPTSWSPAVSAGASASAEPAGAAARATPATPRTATSAARINGVALMVPSSNGPRVTDGPERRHDSAARAVPEAFLLVRPPSIARYRDPRRVASRTVLQAPRHLF